MVILVALLLLKIFRSKELERSRKQMRPRIPDFGEQLGFVWKLSSLISSIYLELGIRSRHDLNADIIYV
jgi:hypothetical protein